MSIPVNRSLMIIDDDDDLRTILADILTTQGFMVAAFGQARTALAALEVGQAPFLILLDLMMPGMSGWEFRAAQLENARLARIPVVVVTAANILNEGAGSLPDVEILRKPFDLDTLLAVVDRYAAAARASR
ncbi:MAG: response regulator [Actinobacteria bacterium]|nr:MAG: response regulator [Actinomycetota bacterium]